MQDGADCEGVEIASGETKLDAEDHRNDADADAVLVHVIRLIEHFPEALR